MSLSCTFFEDGSFDINAGALRVRNALPGMDGVAVRVRKVDIETAGAVTVATYHLQQGTLSLRCEREGDFLALHCEVEGMDQAPHWLQPLCGGRIEGARSVFRHGLGFGGPGGFVRLAGTGKELSHEGYLTMGLVDVDDAALVFGAREHRRFLQKSVVRNRIERGQFENRAIEAEAFFLELAFSTECLAWNGEKVSLPTLYFTSAESSQDALGRMAQSVAEANHIELRHKPCYHYCSWYRKACYYTLQDLEGLIEGLSHIDPPLGIQSVQIDDGCCDSPGDWLIPSQRWPGGMQVAFDKIAAGGYRPGIWVAPFMIGNQSRLYAQHPDWVLRDLEGQPIAKWKNYKGGGIASHTDEETYILDTSHPEAFEYLREVFRSFRAWGARMYKTDFMDWGLQDSTKVLRHAPGRTSVEYFVDVLAMIREAIGPESYWLACISPFAPFLGFADGMRIANDVHTWNPGGLGNMLGQTEPTLYFNNVYWQNDPDVLYLRDNFSELSDREVRSLALWDGMTGGSINTSDFFHELPPERLALWRFLRPTDDPTTASVPLWNRPCRFRVLARRYASEDAWSVLFLNATEETHTEVFAVEALVGLDAAHVWRWGPEGNAPYQSADPQTRINVTLEAHETLLLYLSARDEAPSSTLTLGGRKSQA